MASLGQIKPMSEIFIDLFDADDDDEVRVLKFKLENTSFLETKKFQKSLCGGGARDSFLNFMLHVGGARERERTDLKRENEKEERERRSCLK